MHEHQHLLGHALPQDIENIICGYLYCQMELWAGRMDAVKCCGRDGIAHKWREIIMAYLEKSFFEIFFGNRNTVFLVQGQTVEAREDTTNTPWIHSW